MPQMNRRTAIKVGVGATAAAALWAEPTVKGLARRPAYAAGGSAGDTITIRSERGFLRTPDDEFSIEGPDGKKYLISVTDIGGGMVFVGARSAEDPRVECRVRSVGQAVAATSDGDVEGVVNGGSLVFDIGRSELRELKWADLVIECRCV
jgi:hypothetical protein